MHELESSVVDTVTGFAGKISARAEYVGGTVRYLVEAPSGNMDSAAQKGTAEWFDAGRLQVVEADEAVGPGQKIRDLTDVGDAALSALERVQELLDATICSCTLAKRCPKHDPERPTIGQGG